MRFERNHARASPLNLAVGIVVGPRCHNGVMPPPTTPFAADVVEPRLDVLFEEIAELTGQRNAIDGRLVEIIAEIDGDHLWGGTGCTSVQALVAWKTGVTPRNAETMVAVAHRLEELPGLAQGLREGRLSLDRVGVIAERGGPGCDAHYANLVQYATVSQLRTAVKMEPRPEPESKPEPKRGFSSFDGDGYTTYRIRLPKLEAAKFDAAVASHKDALVADWKRDHDHDPDALDEDGVQIPPPPQAPPFPDTTDAFMSLVEAGWDTDVAARPHGARTTVIAHFDIEKRIAALHLGLALSDEERRLLLCDATCEVWLQRHGTPIGAARSTRTISRRLRRALEYRDRCCVVPGCGATRGLHAHHLVHWEDGGPTELWNLVLLCPFHHRLHHKGGITLTGPADQLKITDEHGRTLSGAALARPPTTPAPDVPPCTGPTGGRAQWWWYSPYEPPSSDT